MKTKQALTFDGLDKIKEGYTFKADGVGIYAGWTGCNNVAIYGKELKDAIIAELKKNGIKATARQGRGGYTDSFTFTITVPEQFFVPEAEYIKRMFEAHTDNRYFWRNPEGGAIHSDLFWNLEEAERQAIREYNYKKDYEKALEDGDDNFVEPAFVDAVKTIISSFNSDHSDTMTDYFDRKFYDWYRWKTA